MRCLSCEYDLSHLTEHRCPECGREFDPVDPTTFLTQARMRRATIRLRVFAVVYPICFLNYFLQLRPDFIADNWPLMWQLVFSAFTALLPSLMLWFLVMFLVKRWFGDAW